MTLKELRELVNMEHAEDRVPSKGMLEKMKAEVIVRERINGDTEIAVYKNGYVLYQAGNGMTVFPIPPCKSYTYNFVSDKNVLDPELFENENWYIRLMMEGEDRIVDNVRRQENRNSVFSYSDRTEDESSDLIDRSPGILEKLIQEEMVNEIWELITDKQKEVLYSYYFEEMTQTEIADRLGITQQQACRRLQRTLRRLKKKFEVQDGSPKK